MENVQIPSFNEFCEQLNDIRIKFQKWDICEKTVGLFYLMAGLPFANARFLQNALEQYIISEITIDNQGIERNANDSTFISNFLLETPQTAISLILSHLPLLKPDNKDTADCFLKIIRKVLSENMVPPFKIHNELVEIMSYVYIHPAFTNEDKTSLKNLVKEVFDKVNPENIPPAKLIEESENLKLECEENENARRMNRRSFSLIPGQLSSKESCIFSQENSKDIWYSSENLSQLSSKPRSYSLSSEKPLLFGSSNLQASISDTRLQDLVLMNNRNAMKSIIVWLKSLRLHKYSWVFNNLTFNQMLNLTEDTLEAIGITKGARNKLMLNIAKLRERSSMLTELENEVMNGGDLNIALKKLKNVLQSPLQLTVGEDLQSLFVKVTGKVYTQLLMLRQPSDELLNGFNALCERAETIEDAFNDEQKKKLNMWRNQLMKAESFPIYTHQDNLSTKCQRTQADGKYYLAKLCSMTSSYTKKSSSFPNMKNNMGLNKHRHSVGTVTLQNQLHSMHQYQNILKNGYQHQNECPKRVFEKKIDDFCDRRDSVRSEQNSHSTDIESSLESLCIQMMEHALGP